MERNLPSPKYKEMPIDFPYQQFDYFELWTCPTDWVGLGTEPLDGRFKETECNDHSK